MTPFYVRSTSREINNLIIKRRQVIMSEYKKGYLKNNNLCQSCEFVIIFSDFYY